MDDDVLGRVAGKRRQREEASSQSGSGRTIPDTVVYYEILPRLSFKTLSRLTGVCKDWHAFIAGKSCEPSSSSCCSSSSSSCSSSSSSLALASEQSRRPSAASVAFVTLSASGRLRFLPPAAPVAVPDPFLSFIPLRKWRRRRIAASAGGLLCLHLTRGGEDVALYVVNPATKQGQFVPPSGGNRCHPVGLAFDPSNSPDRYRLVRAYGRDPRPHHSRQWMTVNYRFDVFSSETGRWVESGQRVRLRRTFPLVMKPVYAQGVVYWRCHGSLLWYDPARDRAGAFALPEKRRGTVPFLDDIGVHEGGQLSCTRAWAEALELWLCAPPCGPWQKVHEKSWGEMIPANADAFGLCNTETSCPAELQLQVWRPGGWLRSWFVWPLCFLREEKKLYLGVKATRTRSGARVLCYDITTGEAVDTGKVLRRWNIDCWTSSYHNSMVALPEIGGQSICPV